MQSEFDDPLALFDGFEPTFGFLDFSFKFAFAFAAGITGLSFEAFLFFAFGAAAACGSGGSHGAGLVIAEVAVGGECGTLGGGFGLVEVILVVASVACELAAGDMQDDLGHAADEVNVVADENQGSLVVFECSDEGVDAAHVEMGGGLIHEQEVGGLQEHADEGEAAFFATAEDGDEFEDIVTTKQEGAEEGARQLLAGAAGQIHGRLKHGVLHVQSVAAILGEVAELGVVSGFDLAALRSEHAREELQQGGLACSVGSDKDDALTALHFKVEPGVNGKVAIRKVDVLHGDNTLPGTLRLGEAELHFFVLGNWSFDLFHSIDHFEFVLGSGSEIGFGFEAIGPILHLRDFLLLVLVRGDELFLARGFFPQVVVVVAFVAGDFGLGNLEDGVTQGVEENTVVGNEQNGTGVAGEVVLKPDE